MWRQGVKFVHQILNQWPPVSLLLRGSIEAHQSPPLAPLTPPVAIPSSVTSSCSSPPANPSQTPLFPTLMVPHTLFVVPTAVDGLTPSVLNRWIKNLLLRSFATGFTLILFHSYRKVKTAENIIIYFYFYFIFCRCNKNVMFVCCLFIYGVEKFKIASYNILGDKNAFKHKDLYPNVPLQYIKWSHRGRLICQELIGLSPDIICMQVSFLFTNLLLSFSLRKFQ